MVTFSFGERKGDAYQGFTSEGASTRRFPKTTLNLRVVSRRE